MRILVIADYLPFPLIGGDRIRIYNLLRRVARSNEVSFAGFLEKPEDEVGISNLRKFCKHVEVVNLPKKNKLAKAAGMFKFAISGKPPELSLLHSKELEEKIYNLATLEDFDIVQIEHSHMGLYLEALPKNNRSKKILMFHNITSHQYERVAQIERNWKRKFRAWVNGVSMGFWEPRYAERFDRSATVSEEDRDLLLAANSNLKVDVIPNGVDIQEFQPLPFPSNDNPLRLLFIGNMGYPPCADAVIYFCEEIFPHIQAEIPNAEFWIVGRDPSSDVLRLDGNGVHVTGRVEDIIPFYQKTFICVVPLRAGGGTRLKILEAMALGRPVVSTSIGCEGLEVSNGKNLLVADTPKRFADETIRLFTDRPLYESITIEGRKLVESTYSWDQIAEKLMQVYSDMAE